MLIKGKEISETFVGETRRLQNQCLPDDIKKINKTDRCIF